MSARGDLQMVVTNTNEHHTPPSHARAAHQPAAASQRQHARTRVHGGCGWCLASPECTRDPRFLAAPKCARPEAPCFWDDDDDELNINLPSPCQ